MATAVGELLIQDAADAPPMGPADRGYFYWDGNALSLAEPTQQILVGGGRSWTIANASDFAGVPDVGTDGYAITWNNTTGKFGLSALETAGTAAALMAAHLLAPDPHPQYVLLAGRAGGQIVNGGTGAAEPLILRGTAHATPGDVYVTIASGARSFSAFAGGGVMVGPHTALIPSMLNGVSATPAFQIASTGANASLLMARYSATNPARIFFLRSRGTTIGDVTAVQAGDVLGAFTWAGTNGTVAAEAAQLRAYATITQAGTANTAAAIAFFTSPGGATTPQERVTIYHDGNTGFGITVPTALVHVAASNATRASLSLAHGVAPTVPINGDIWTTTAGLHLYINGNAEDALLSRGTVTAATMQKQFFALGLGFNGNFTDGTVRNSYLFGSTNIATFTPAAAVTQPQFAVDGVMLITGAPGAVSSNVGANNWDLRITTTGGHVNLGAYNPAIAATIFSARTLSGFSGTIAGEFVGGQFGVSHTAGAGNISGPMVGLQVRPPGYTAGGTVSGAVYGARLANQGNAAWATSYGLYIDAQTGSTANAYALYTNGGLVRFGDQVQLIAGTTALASLRVPHGAAPTTPVNGDIWTTTAGLFVRINGVTVGPLT